MSQTQMSQSVGTSFDVFVGTKRQFTIPADLYKQLGLKEGDSLRLTLQGETVQMEPLVTVPKSAISPAVLAKMRSRMGLQDDDMTLEEFQAFRRKMKEDRPAAEAEVRTTMEARARKGL